MNRTIIISGGGSGIGYATAKKFLENLDNVVIAGKEKEKYKMLKKHYSKNIQNQAFWHYKQTCLIL